MAQSPAGPLGKIVYRLRRSGLGPYLLGLWLRRHFQKAGIITIDGGWPLPKIVNQGGSIELENCALYSGTRLECGAGARIFVGNGTYLNRGVEVVAAQSVRIGRDCKIARDVIIMDTDQHALPGRGLVVKPVEIGDRVWIGARAIVLKGVVIGHDSIVAAGAIVTKSVPPYSLVAGPAARVIRRLDGEPAP